MRQFIFWHFKLIYSTASHNCNLLNVLALPAGDTQTAASASEYDNLISHKSKTSDMPRTRSNSSSTRSTPSNLEKGNPKINEINLKYRRFKESPFSEHKTTQQYVLTYKCTTNGWVSGRQQPRWCGAEQKQTARRSGVKGIESDWNYFCKL